MLTEQINQMKINNVVLCDEDIRNYYAEDGKETEMIIDSGCPSSLASEKILRNYIKNIDMEYEELESRTVDTSFKFGKNRYFSEKIVKIPIRFQTVEGTLASWMEVYVVKDEVSYIRIIFEENSSKFKCCKSSRR